MKPLVLYYGQYAWLRYFDRHRHYLLRLNPTILMLLSQLIRVFWCLKNWHLFPLTDAIFFRSESAA